MGFEWILEKLNLDLNREVPDMDRGWFSSKVFQQSSSRQCAFISLDELEVFTSLEVICSST